MSRHCREKGGLNLGALNPIYWRDPNRPGLQRKMVMEEERATVSEGRGRGCERSWSIAEAGYQDRSDQGAQGGCDSGLGEQQ